MYHYIEKFDFSIKNTNSAYFCQFFKFFVDAAFRPRTGCFGAADNRLPEKDRRGYSERSDQWQDPEDTAQRPEEGSQAEVDVDWLRHGLHRETGQEEHIQTTSG